MSESIFHVTIVEELDGTVPPIERLSMRLDGPAAKAQALINQVHAQLREEP